MSLAVLDTEPRTRPSELERFDQLPLAGVERGDGGVWGAVVVVVGTDLLPGGEPHHGDGDGVTRHHGVTELINQLIIIQLYKKIIINKLGKIRLN